MLPMILGALGAVAFLATCIAGEHVRNELKASGLHPAAGLIGD